MSKTKCRHCRARAWRGQAGSAGEPRAVARARVSPRRAAEALRRCLALTQAVGSRLLVLLSSPPCGADSEKGPDPCGGGAGRHVGGGSAGGGGR